MRETVKISDKKWKEFNLVELFAYKRGNQNNMNSLCDGSNLLISAKNGNNGLKGFYDTDNKKKGLFNGHCITLNNDGDGGVGFAYYQPYSFLLDSHVYALYQKSCLDKYSLLFISKVISKQRDCFSHGHSISEKRLGKMKIMLPIKEDGSPDYNFMENYGRYLMVKQYKKYLNFKKMS